MNVRAAGPGDRAAIAACLRSDATFRADEIEVALALVDDAFAGDPDYALVVADAGGAVVGYACFGPTAMTCATWDLYWIAVAAPARGQGVGAALIAAVEAHIGARGAGAHVRIETGASAVYAAARALYARARYAEIATLPDFYAAGDAMIVYYKAL
jgi:ribosomal protein S18 acetylase RimI-like enzyme